MSDPENRREYIRQRLNDPNIQMSRGEFDCGPLSMTLLIVIFIALFVFMVMSINALSGKPTTFNSFWPMVPILLLAQASVLAWPRIVRIFRRQQTEQDKEQPWTLVAVLLFIILLLALLAWMPSIMAAIGGPHVDAVPVWYSLPGIAAGAIIARGIFFIYRHRRGKKTT